ncbi:ABC transporter [Hyphomicrobium methylovorum]|uniref:ABC transporter ATP-binding protein n=1 Tax=Hyphomicrobium methylovorum TaxID=84 RepID=UPI0015E63288|nr:ATP-binding cassette domain-containing protein [Hyphomicrobium methylovorum]MBA2124951.1 ABC transporter [Hyphomicrobium methylovorum]
MLRFDDVSLDFGTTPVIDGLDLTVNAGELVVMLGQSGCGKTSALRIAAGLLQPRRGRVLNTFTRTACVFQEPRLLPWASALENASFAMKALGMERGERLARAKALLRRFGLKNSDLNKRSGELSGGMAQRVATARALAIDPQLILMDEPFGALDSGLRREMQDMVRVAVRESAIAVLFVTHDVTEAVRLADRIIVMAPTPTKVVADLSNSPPSTQVGVYEASAEILRHPAVVAALMTSDAIAGSFEAQS